MNTSASPDEKIPVSVQAEAAAWIARLHGADRTEDDERGFRRWLAENERHAAVFERATELWESAARLKSGVLARHRKPSAAAPARGPNKLFWPAVTAVVLACVAALLYFYDPAVSTQLGERRNLMLEDGTRLTLNTATRLRVQYSRTRRVIELEQGEAVFEVARRPGWPFVVMAGGREVHALGTEFIVRREGDTVAVTLLDGKVAVASAAAATSGDRQTRTVLMPGQRLVSPPGEPFVLDRPALKTVTAWRQGLIALDRTPLREAVAEMNRYSAVKLLIPQGSATDVKVSGVFRAGESQEFVKALMKSHGLELSLVEEGG